MHKHIRAGALIGVMLVLAGWATAAQSQAKNTIEVIRKELLQLPYYGVFDYLAFKYDRGTVTLMGYAYHPALKSDAERAIKRVAGVDQVENKVEEVPPSLSDDELRWKAYYAIYGDAFLSRYAPGGGMLWGHRHALGGGLHTFGGPAQFVGMEPAGDFPIHIIVSRGRIRLLGVVDNEADKVLAEHKARELPGSFGVENDLAVENARQSTKR